MRHRRESQCAKNSMFFHALIYRSTYGGREELTFNGRRINMLIGKRHAPFILM